jgi:hypothetical protein
MRIMVKAFLVGTVGMAVLFGSPAVTQALPKLVLGKTYCWCRCYSKESGNVQDLAWEKVGACSGANGKKCSFKRGGQTIQGKLEGCEQCTVKTTEGVCEFLGGRAYQATRGFDLTVAPEVAPPPPTPRPGKAPRPGGIQTK